MLVQYFPPRYAFRAEFSTLIVENQYNQRLDQHIDPDSQNGGIKGSHGAYDKRHKRDKDQGAKEFKRLPDSVLIRRFSTQERFPFSRCFLSFSHLLFPPCPPCGLRIRVQRGFRR